MVMEIPVFRMCPLHAVTVHVKRMCREAKKAGGEGALHAGRRKTAIANKESGQSV